MQIAHIVSRDGLATDAALHGVADALIASGRRVCGALQITERNADKVLGRMELRLLPDDTRRNIAQPVGLGATACRLDAGALEAAVVEVTARLEAGADLLLLGRFSEMEATGRGFRDVIALAVVTETPVLLGVSAAWCDAFAAFTDNASTELPAEREALLTWAVQACARA